MRAWKDVAELTSTKTLNGGLVVRCAPGLPFLLYEGVQVAFVPPVIDAPRRAWVESVQMQGADAAVVKFAGIDDADVARSLVGCHCLMRREDVPEGKRIGASDADTLAGFRVIDARAGILGTLQGVRTLPGQRLLEVARTCAEGAGEDVGKHARDASLESAEVPACASGFSPGEQPFDPDPLLIPLVDEFVSGIDEGARRIDVCVPSGLLEL